MAATSSGVGGFGTILSLNDGENLRLEFLVESPQTQTK